MRFRRNAFRRFNDLLGGDRVNERILADCDVNELLGCEVCSLQNVAPVQRIAKTQNTTNSGYGETE
jgi:hypothetical protein